MVLGGSQKDDTDHNDASVVYSHALGGLLGAEVGVVGFGCERARTIPPPRGNFACQRRTTTLSDEYVCTRARCNDALE